MQTMDEIEEANTLHRGIEEWIKQGLQKVKDAIRIGEILTKYRAKFPPRSGWIKQFEKDFEFSIQTANRYIRFWEHRSILTTVVSINEAIALTEGKGQRPAKQKSEPIVQSAEIAAKHLAKGLAIKEGLVIEFVTDEQIQKDAMYHWGCIIANHGPDYWYRAARFLVEYLEKEYPLRKINKG